MRKEFAFLKKTTAAKNIKNEDVLGRNGFTIARKEVGTGSYRKLLEQNRPKMRPLFAKSLF
jgi:hypothetical protein